MKRDFTQEVKNELKDLIDEKYDDSWQTPQIEFPGDLLNAQIETDWEMLTKKNQELSIKNFVTSQQIDKIWSEVLQIDTTFKNRFVALNEAIKAYGECLRVIKEKICPTAILNTLKGNSQALLSDLGNVTEKFYTQMVEYEYEKLILRDENQNIIDYDWENIEKFMVMDTKKISVYQLDAFVKMFDELDCTIEKQREIMEKFLEKAYIKSEYIKETGLMISMIPTNRVSLSETFAEVMKRYCERNSGNLKEYQVLNRDIFYYLLTFGDYFMLPREDEFQVELLHGIEIEDRIKAGLKYDFTIDFPNAKVTENVEAVAWCNVDDAKGYIFQQRDGHSIEDLFADLSIIKIQSMKRNKQNEISKTVIGTLMESVIGLGMTTGQGIVFTGGTTMLDIMELEIEIDTFNKNIEDGVNKLEMGQMLDSLGIENISVQVFQEQAHTKFPLESVEIYERLYIYLQDTTEKNPNEINEIVEKKLQDWSKTGKIDVNEEFLKDYCNWFSYEDGRSTIEKMKIENSNFYDGNGGE